ncbi:MAG: PEP-CTERM sorting domain-containing protein [Pseudomonadota bacterium]
MALQAGFVHADEVSRLFVANSRGNNIVAYAEGDGRFLGEIVSEGSGGLHHPDTMLIGPDGKLYVSSGVSEKDSAILRFDPSTGDFLGRFAQGNGMQRPYGIAFGPDGLLYVASFRTDRIMRFDGRSGAFHDVFAEGNGEPGGLNGPTGITFGPDGALYVSTQGSVADAAGAVTYPGLPSQVLRFDVDSGRSPVFIDQPEPSTESGGSVSLLGVVFGPDCERSVSNQCDIFVSDFLGGIRRYDRQGSLKASLSTNYLGSGPGAHSVGGMTFGVSGQLYAAAFNRRHEKSAGAILRYGTTRNQADPTVNERILPFVAETQSMERPIGILAVPASQVRAVTLQ